MEMMKLDEIIRIDDSFIQHGKYNDRVYIMKITDENYKEVIKTSEKLAKENNYGKIFAKAPFHMGEEFEKKGYILEATIPDFYKNGEECLFYSKYYFDKRAEDFFENENEECLQEAFKSTLKSKEDKQDEELFIKVAGKENAEDIACLLKAVFKTYPFPVFDKEYILKTMEDNVKYYCYYDGNILAGVSSSEKDIYNKNAEMTDFAVKKEYRGKSISKALLKAMEKDLKEEDYRVLYTIARAGNLGINILFAREGYIFSGKAVNNTNISGNIESMNLWYKKL
jgi:putative beta-lysine N-acetyltransferase